MYIGLQPTTKSVRFYYFAQHWMVCKIVEPDLELERCPATMSFGCTWCTWVCRGRVVLPLGHLLKMNKSPTVYISIPVPHIVTHFSFPPIFTSTLSKSKGFGFVVCEVWTAGRPCTWSCVLYSRDVAHCCVILSNLLRCFLDVMDGVCGIWLESQWPSSR